VSCSGTTCQIICSGGTSCRYGVCCTAAACLGTKTGSCR
jgi:hypothetical protein